MRTNLCRFIIKNEIQREFQLLLPKKRANCFIGKNNFFKHKHMIMLVSLNLKGFTVDDNDIIIS